MDEETLMSGVNTHSLRVASIGWIVWSVNFRTPWVSMEDSRWHASHFLLSKDSKGEVSDVDKARWSLRILYPALDGWTWPTEAWQVAHWSESGMREELEAIL